MHSHKRREWVKFAHSQCADLVAGQVEPAGHETSTQSALVPQPSMPTGCVSMHVHMCACGYVSMRVFLFITRACIHTHTIARLCLHTWTHARAGTHTHTCSWLSAGHTNTSAHMHVYTYTHTCTRTHTHTYTQTTRIHVLTRTHTRTRIRTKKSFTHVRARALPQPSAHIHTYTVQTRTHTQPRPRTYAHERTHAHTHTPRKGIRTCACTGSSPIVYAYKHLIPFICLMHQNDMYHIYTNTYSRLLYVYV